MGPTNPASEQAHSEKYREKGESFAQGMRRIASGISDSPAHQRVFEEIIQEQRFAAAGRVQAAIGSSRNITPYNCYVSSTIHDSFVHDPRSIMDIAKRAATTMRMGGGIGYDFSSLRPANDIIHGVQATTDGPLAFMPIFDAVCKATSSAGNRRGAQMGVLRIDHPDIMRFLRCKQPQPDVQALWDHVEALPDSPERFALVSALQKTLPLTGFNISVAVTDKFMHALALGLPHELTFGGRSYGFVDAQELWDTLMKGTWDWAEPGVLFIDTINRMNNLWYAEEIKATNPCGEQPLPDDGACLLGSFNLTKYIVPVEGEGRAWEFDWWQFDKDVEPVVRAMDMVVDVATYPLPEQETEAKNKRRMGLGITGLANAAEALGFPYGTKDFLEFEALVLDVLRERSYEASVKLAREKGAFPLFADHLYPKGEFIQTLDPGLQKDIAQYGIRNSHLGSIAPTGTISFTMDNVSSSIEPVFMVEGTRKMNLLGGQVEVPVNDYGFERFGVMPKTADKVTIDEHVDVLVTAAKRVDSAVSKTCNVSPDMPWEDFKNVYVRAYEGGAKGCTTFNPGGKRLGIFTAKAPAESCTWDPETGRRSCE